MLDPVLSAAHVEHVRYVASCRAIRVARREGELDAVVGEDGVDLVGHGLDQGREEGGGGCPHPLRGRFDRAANGAGSLVGRDCGGDAAQHAEKEGAGADGRVGDHNVAGREAGGTIKEGPAQSLVD